MNQKHFNQLKKTWEQFGEQQPHWSVLTIDKFKPDSIQDNIEEFYQSGVYGINNLEQKLNNYGHSFDNKVVLDYGCGVGRLTKACCNFTSNVYGMDISKSHLEIAQQNVPAGQFFLVDDLKTLPELPQQPDIIYSLIVLQHARPPVIAHTLHLLLQLLAPNGIAMIHLPYNIDGYKEIKDQQGIMEMHFLPKHQVRKIVQNNRCEVLGEIDSSMCGSSKIHECVYVIKKQCN